MARNFLFWLIWLPKEYSQNYATKQSCNPTIFETVNFFDPSVSTDTKSPLNPSSEEESLQLGKYWSI